MIYVSLRKELKISEGIVMKRIFQDALIPAKLTQIAIMAGYAF